MSKRTTDMKVEPIFRTYHGLQTIKLRSEILLNNLKAWVGWESLISLKSFN